MKQIGLKLLVIASHFKENENLKEEIINKLGISFTDGKYFLKNELDEYKIYLIQIYFNAQTLNTGLPSHDKEELFSLIYKLESLSIEALEGLIGWMSQQNEDLEEPTSFCTCCKREDNVLIDAPGIGDIFVQRDLVES